MIISRRNHHGCLLLLVGLRRSFVRTRVLSWISRHVGEDLVRGLGPYEWLRWSRSKISYVRPRGAGAPSRVAASTFSPVVSVCGLATLLTRASHGLDSSDGAADRAAVLPAGITHGARAGDIGFERRSAQCALTIQPGDVDIVVRFVSSPSSELCQETRRAQQRRQAQRTTVPWTKVTVWPIGAWRASSPAHACYCDKRLSANTLPTSNGGQPLARSARADVT